MSELRMSRARRFADGWTVREIATEDHVHESGIREALRGVLWKAGRIATPGSVLPEGLQWVKNMQGNDRAMQRGRMTRQQVTWALAVLDEAPRVLACECCGRPL